MQKSVKANEAFHRYGSIFILSLTGAIVAYLFWNLTMPRMDFYNNLWAPAYLLSQGNSPYNTAGLHPVLPPLWFPMAIGFFSPLGWVNETAALKIWYVLTIFELCAVIFIAQGNKRTVYSTFFLALLCFFFPFVLNNYNLGQFSITTMLCLMLSAYFSEHRQNWLSAGFLALALSKPQLGLIAVFGLSVFHFQNDGFKGVLRFGLQTFLMALLMSLPLFVIFPAWIPDWIKSIQANQLWQHPSIFSMLKLSTGIWGDLAWALMMIPALGISHQLWTKTPPPTAMMWSMGITTIISPYIWGWDFVLLLPIWMHTYSKMDWKGKAVLLASYGIAWYGIAFVQRMESSNQQLFWWVPLWIIGSLVLIIKWRTTQKP